MKLCYSRAKSIINKLLFSNKNDENTKERTVEASSTNNRQEDEVHQGDFHMVEGFPSGTVSFSSAPIQASEILVHIVSWPVWKRLLDSRHPKAGLLDRSWILERVPDPAPFNSLQSVEDILAALEFSHQNCIFEGPHRSQNPDSVLYCTTLDKIAKFDCCAKCKVVAGALKPEFTVLEPHHSRSKNVIIWYANWGNLEANGPNEAVTARAFQEGTLFLTIGGNKALFEKFWPATLKLDHYRYFSFAQDMLNTCQQLHECCRCDRKGAPPYTPRRLIYIGSHRMDLRLVETDDGDEIPADTYTYAALSYCWGTSGKNYKTTQQNLSKNKIGLPWRDLPATITDATYVCRALGIPYLWVDAICIIQDDQKDWEEQSAKMQEVYSNCFLALAAEDTEDCGLGFLPRISRQKRGNLTGSGNRNETLRTWSRTWGGKSTPMALLARGWTLQERILPCRTLRFTSVGLTWECNQNLSSVNEAEGRDLWSLTSRAIRLATSDQGNITIPANRGTRVDQSKDGQDITHRNIENFIALGPSKATCYAWYSIAENYSSRALTNPADKLVALSGLASLLASSIAEGADDYLAGHWRKDLVEGLLWHTAEPCRRYLTYIAPSWSWASMDGKISYFRERDQFSFQSHIEVKEAVCHKTLFTPAGSIYGGHIILIGEVVPVHVFVMGSSSPSRGNYVSRYPGWGGQFGRAYEDQLVFVCPFGTPKSLHWEVLCDERMPFTADCTLEGHCKLDSEYSAKSESHPQFFCLSFGRMHHRSNMLGADTFRHWWLLMEASPPGKHVYRRIGIGYYHRSTPDLFDLAVTEAVTII